MSLSVKNIRRERENNEDIDNNTKDESKTKTQKNKDQLGVLGPEDIEKIERRKIERRERERFEEINVDTNTKDENKTKAQKDKCQLIFTWALLILCGVVFIVTPLRAFLCGVLFTLKTGIPVAGIMIFSGFGFGFLFVELKQQNSDISLSSDNKDTNYPEIFVDYNSKEIKSPLLENETKNKGAK